MQAVIILVELLWLAAAALAYCFVCQICGKRCSYLQTAGYAALSGAVSWAQSLEQWPAVVVTLAQALLLALCARLLARCAPQQALAAALLATAIWCLGSGVLQSLGHGLVSALPAEAIWLLPWLDLVLAVLMVLGLALAFYAARRSLSSVLAELRELTAFLVAGPACFWVLTEQLVVEVVYGHEVVWDNALGLVAPVVDDGRWLLWQVAAALGLYALLLLCRRLGEATRAKMQWQQLHQQAMYNQEAQARDKQTRAFRHDVKNHLLVLERLLEKGETAAARSYLAQLAQAAQGLFFPSHTGNKAVDALLSSKLAAAEAVRITCDCPIPPRSGVTDLDWCILLANAIDNALAANRALPPRARFLSLNGRRQGSFYLLQVENACKPDLAAPVYGTGLANMQAVAEKYGGTMTVQASDGVFRLKALLVISQQTGDISQQSP